MKSAQSGFSLVEAILVIFVGGLLIVLVANLPNAFNLVSKSKNLSLAREIAVKKIEDVRAINYDNLSLGTEVITDSRISLLPQGGGTFTVGECDVEICTNNEEIKVVNVLITWKENAKDQKLALTTYIGQGGLNQ